MDTGFKRGHGQALVIFVLAIVALLGFTALAIDGGMVYSDRRHAQSGADASSLAGGAATALYLENHYVTHANFSCSSNVVEAAMAAGRNAAVGRAADNDYTIDQDISDNNGVETICGSENHGGWREQYIDIHTAITRDTQTSFAHFVFGGLLRNQVEAVTRIRPRTGVGFGNAIVAIREDCPNSDTGGVLFDGTSDLVITGGGIWSNACMNAGGNVSVEVYGGEVNCVGDGCYTDNGGAEVSPDPTAVNDPIPPELFYVPPPDCSIYSQLLSHSGSGTIQPGRYSSIRLNSTNDALTLAPGLYCMEGDFVANGGTVMGDGVTIYIETGNFDIAGGVTVVLSAPPSRDCDYCPPPIEGVLIYLAEGNEGEVTLLGTSDSQYTGLVYAPDGVIETGGSGSELSKIQAQLVGGTVKMHGTTEVFVNFNGNDNYTIPAMLELNK